MVLYHKVEIPSQRGKTGGRLPLNRRRLEGEGRQDGGDEGQNLDNRQQTDPRSDWEISEPGQL